MAALSRCVTQTYVHVAKPAILPGAPLLIGLTMSFFLQTPPDISAHNAEVAAVWQAYRAGRPYRVPA